MTMNAKQAKEYYVSMKLKSRIKKQLLDKSDNKILVICDFSDVPLALGDVMCLLWNADVFRKAKEVDKMDIAFVWHRGDAAFNLDYIDEESFEYFFYNLAVEATRLFSSIGGIFTFSNRWDFHSFFDYAEDKYRHIYPEDYDYMYPIEHREDRPACYWYSTFSSQVEENNELLTLEVPKRALELCDSWLNRFVYPEIPITITLRECEPVCRTNNIEEWQKIIDHYSEENIKFIVLRDYAKLYDYPVLFGNNVLYWDSPVLSTTLRAALYQQAKLNLFVLSGSNMLAHLNNKVNYIVFRFHTVGGSGVSSKNHIKKIFMVKEPDNFIGATKYQKIVWEPDTFEVMRYNVDNMIDVLKQDGEWI